jgi:hypothetical protein
MQFFWIAAGTRRKFAALHDHGALHFLPAAVFIITVLLPVLPVSEL